MGEEYIPLLDGDTSYITEEYWKDILDIRLCI